jgi:hypothetical protein
MDQVVPLEEDGDVTQPVIPEFLERRRQPRAALDGQTQLVGLDRSHGTESRPRQRG